METRETRPYPWMCPRCRQREVYSDVVDYKTTIEHDGRSYTVRVPSLEVPKCRNCGKLVLVDSANRRISEAFRREAGLMAPEEIRAGRVRCGLDQQAFAELLGISVSTLSRWETGAQIQQRSLNRVMEAYFASPEVREVYGQLSSSASSEHRAAPVGVTSKRKAGTKGSKMSTMTQSENGTAVEESRAVAARCWALKTTRGEAGPSMWRYFLRDGVIAVGWPDIGVDPRRDSKQGLCAAIQRAYPDEEDPAGAADKIKTFIGFQESRQGGEGDLVLICRGYPPNQKKPVHIFGFARVTGPFQNYLAAAWPWRFKHEANIQPVENDLAKADVERALGMGSLRETIHELDPDAIYRVAKLLGVRVTV